MKLARHRLLDALCGEYIAGTLRGAARRRFERALRAEPLVAQRLAYWQRVAVPRHADAVAVAPPAGLWDRLRKDLALDQLKTPWWRQLGLWQGWAAAATMALLVVVGLQIWRPAAPPIELAQIAVLRGEAEAAVVAAALSRDGAELELRADRTVAAGPQQSYELWLLPAEGTPPISLAVLGKLDGRFKLPVAQVGRLRAGAKLAISVEPAGGSPTGAPTGPVILVGAITV